MESGSAKTTHIKSYSNPALVQTKLVLGSNIEYLPIGMTARIVHMRVLCSCWAVPVFVRSVGGRYVRYGDWVDTSKPALRCSGKADSWPRFGLFTPGPWIGRGTLARLHTLQRLGGLLQTALAKKNIGLIPASLSEGLPSVFYFVLRAQWPSPQLNGHVQYRLFFISLTMCILFRHLDHQ